MELTGLPNDATIKWNNMGNIPDEDMVWVVLDNGIGIDAGQYGIDPFFRVVVIPEERESLEWTPVETVLCQTLEEVAAEIVRLANKYSKPWYANLAKRMAKVPTERI